MLSTGTTKEYDRLFGSDQNLREIESVLFFFFFFFFFFFSFFFFFFLLVLPRARSPTACLRYNKVFSHSILTLILRWCFDIKRMSLIAVDETMSLNGVQTNKFERRR